MWGSLVLISGSWPSQGTPGERSCFCNFKIFRWKIWRGLQLSTLWQHLCGWLPLLPKVWTATCEGTNQQEVCPASILFEWWMSDENYLIEPYRLWQTLIWHSCNWLWYEIDATYYHMVICHVPSGPRRRECRNCSDCLPDVGGPQDLDILQPLKALNYCVPSKSDLQRTWICLQCWFWYNSRTFFFLWMSRMSRVCLKIIPWIRQGISRNQQAVLARHASVGDLSSGFGSKEGFRKMQFSHCLYYLYTVYIILYYI